MRWRKGYSKRSWKLTCSATPQGSGAALACGRGQVLENRNPSAARFATVRNKPSSWWCEALQNGSNGATG